MTTEQRQLVSEFKKRICAEIANQLQGDGELYMRISDGVQENNMPLFDEAADAIRHQMEHKAK